MGRKKAAKAVVDLEELPAGEDSVQPVEQAGQCANSLEAQFLEAKAKSPGALLLFRVGDFYELFHDDAKEAAQILSLTLTSRGKGPNSTPMAGFPHHALEGHLRTFLAAGKRVAICDQIEPGISPAEIPCAPILSTLPDLSANLSDADKVIFREGFEAFLQNEDPIANPYSPVEDGDDDDCSEPDSHKSTMWLAGFTQCGLKEGFDAAKAGADSPSPGSVLIEDCPYEDSTAEELASGEYDWAGVWKQGFKLFTEPTVDSALAVAAVGLVLADHLAEATTDEPVAETKSEPTKPTTPDKTLYDPADWLERIQKQNQIVQAAAADYEGARVVAKARKVSHDAAVDRLTKLIDEQRQAQEDWNRPLPLFDGQGKSESKPDTTSKAGATVEVVDTGKTGPLSDDQVANAWRYANISELSLPGKLTDKLHENGIQTIGELEDFRARPGLNSIKGIGESKVTIIENAVTDWLTIQRDSKAFAAAGSPSPPVATETIPVEQSQLTGGGTTGGGTVGEQIEAAVAGVGVSVGAAPAGDVDFDDI